MEGLRTRIIVGSNVPESIKQKADEYEVLCRKAEGLRTEIVGEITKIQDACEHEQPADMEVLREWDPDYVSKVDTPLLMCGANIFVARRCHKCGKDFPRQPGHPHRICHQCGSEMKDAGIMRNHGYNVYTSMCPDCGHVHELIFL